MSRKWFYQGGPNLPDTTLNRRIFSWILFSPPPGDLLSEWPGHGPPPQASPGSPSPHRPPPPLWAAAGRCYSPPPRGLKPGIHWPQVASTAPWQNLASPFRLLLWIPTKTHFESSIGGSGWNRGVTCGVIGAAPIGVGPAIFTGQPACFPDLFPFQLEISVDTDWVICKLIS